MEFLLHLDESIFLLINKTLQNDLFDIILPLVRNKFIWAPLYIFIITYICYNYSIDKASWYILFIISAVAITDVTSGNILKKNIGRERPCQVEDPPALYETRVRCGYSYSFPSAHAANHFGLAVILIALFPMSRSLKYALYGWATLISLAQVYVGVHYPLDVLGGALIGIILVKLYLYLINPLVLRLKEAGQVAI